MISSQKGRGFTFVELVAAIAVMAITIVPAMQYFTESMTLRRELERERVMVLLATQLVESQMAVVNSSFTTTQYVDTFASQGQPDIAYEITRSDLPAEGGIPNLLMAISVRVWSDDNNNLVLDANEAKVDLHTKMARSVES